MADEAVDTATLETGATETGQEQSIGTEQQAGATEGVTEPVIETEPALTETKPKQTPWYMARIAEEAAAKEREATARRAAEQRAADFEQMIKRMQAGEKPAPVAPARGEQDQERFQAAVRQEAQHIRLKEDSTAVLNAGMAQFPDFSDTLSILNSLRVTNDDFVMDLLAVDKTNAHVLLDKLAKNPERAAAFAKMDSRARTAELTRMAMVDQQPKTQTQQAGAPVTPKPAKVSAAPPPKPPINPVATNPNDWMSDEVSDEQFYAGFKNKHPGLFA